MGITNTMMGTHTTCTQGLTYMKPDFTNFFGKTLHEIAVSSSVQEVQDQPSLCETVMFNKDGTATHQWLTKEPPTSTTVKEGKQLTPCTSSTVTYPQSESTKRRTSSAWSIPRRARQAPVPTKTI